MNFMKLLGDVASDDALDLIANTAGIDNSMVKNIMKTSGPSVLSAVANKAKEDDSFIEKALGSFTGKSDSGILDMVLGSQQDAIAEAVSKKLGISSGIVKMVVAKLMPHVFKAIQSGKISPEVISAAAGLADGVDMKDVTNIAGALFGGKGGRKGGFLGGLLGRK